MYRVNINGQLASFRRVGTSVKGSVNTEQVAFSLDKSWDDLEVFACFKNDLRPVGDQEKHVIMPPDRVVTIPWEMYTIEGSLFVGALGLRDGVVVKPTIWVQISVVTTGVDPNGEFAESFTPSVAEQIIAAVNEAQRIAQSVRDDADAGKFNGGYYTPSVEGNFLIFTPSRLDMPTIDPIPIPGGGGGGGTGYTYTPVIKRVSNGYEISWTNDGGLPNPDPVVIPDGKAGVVVSDTEPTDPDVQVWLKPTAQQSPAATEDFVKKYVDQVLGGISTLVGGGF